MWPVEKVRKTIENNLATASEGQKLIYIYVIIHPNSTKTIGNQAMRVMFNSTQIKYIVLNRFSRCPNNFSKAPIKHIAHVIN